LIKPERLRLELLKGLSGRADGAADYVEFLRRFGLLKYMLPSLVDTFDCDGGQHHGEDVWTHCLTACGAITKDNPLLRIAALMHDVGKPHTLVKDGENISFHRHEMVGSSLVSSDLKRLKFSVAERKYVSNVVGMHMRQLEQSGPKGRRRLIADLKAANLDWRDYIRMRIADRAGNLAKLNFDFAYIRRLVRMIKEVTEQKEAAFSIRDLAIGGHEVMDILDVKPGRIIGDVLKGLFEKVLEEPELNNRDSLLDMVKQGAW
jgi:hypothetical protein